MAYVILSEAAAEAKDRSFGSRRDASLRLSMTGSLVWFILLVAQVILSETTAEVKDLPFRNRLECLDDPGAVWR
jgi:hypothetical protein